VGRFPHLRHVRILIVTPASATARAGNRVTAGRWARLLRSLGHKVRVAQAYGAEACDLLVALHARKSYPSIARFRALRPEAPLVVAMTGTDLYGDLGGSARVTRSLELATRIVVLQGQGRDELPTRFRRKARVLYQSASPPPRRFAPRAGVFEICLLCHMRPVKDPFRAAKAVRLLPRASRIRILHLGAALGPQMARRAQAEQRANPRYVWLGDRARGRALRVLARARLLVLTSRVEGAGNALAEALACSVPIVASRIPGVVGTLGRGYPGYFPVADTQALAALLRRVESDAHFHARLRAWCRRLAPLADPRREREAWRLLLDDLEASSSRKVACCI
jgi:putative glycosyltransferase (TIGR04348 family)